MKTATAALTRALLTGAVLLLPALPLSAQQPAPLLQTPDPFRANRVLPVDTAFALNTRIDSDALILDWEIHEGHYLYRKSIALIRPDGSSVELPELPPAQTVTDEFFGESAVYFEHLSLQVPLRMLPAEAGTLKLELRYQGCAEDLYCYPPTQKPLSLPLP